MATATNLGNGFQFTLPVNDAISHTLNVYVDVALGTGNLNASFNDGTTPDYNDSSVSNLTATSTGMYTLTYQAATVPQTLTVTYTLQQGNGSGSTSASDTFNRANATGLGSASDGKNTWSITPLNGSPTWKIVSNQAVMSGGTNDTSVALLGSTPVSDCDALCIIQASNVADGIGTVLRSSARALSYYLARLSNNSFQLIYHTSGTDTLLKSTPATYKINTQYNIRFRAVNQTLYGRFWPNDGSQEPTNWQIMTQDSHIASGIAGMYGQIASSSDTATFDAFSAVDLSGAVSPNAYVGMHAATLPGSTPVTSGDSLVGTPSTPTGPIDLTAEGTNDWAAFGHTGSSSIDHKTSVTQQIPNYTSIGSGAYTQNTGAVLGYSWTDGTPDTSATNTTTEVDVGGVGNGFSLTVPADTTSRTLNVYVTATKAQGQFTATLSDDEAGAVTYTDSSLNDTGTGTAKEYNLTYNTASDNQTLTAVWKMLTDNGGSGGTYTTYDSDTFTRANTTQSATIATGWKNASSGSTWTNQIISGTPLYQISSNKGTVSASGAASVVYTTLGTGVQSNVEGLVRVGIGSSASTNTLALVLRKTANTTDYRARLSSGNNFTITRRVNSTDTDIATTSYPYSANTSHWIRFRVDGANVYAKAWASGGTEPTSWALSATDSSPITGAGNYGLRTKVAAGDTVSYDGLAFTSITATGATPPGSIGLGAATLIGNATPSPSPTPVPPPNTNVFITVNAADVLSTNWLGYGVEMDAYDHGTGTPIAISAAQRALIIQRLDALNPQIIRTALGNVSWWCPGGVVGTYNFNTTIMQEAYNVFEYAQTNTVPVVVSLLSPSPFTATSTSWCTAFADLLDYLINTLGYSCIQYITGLSQPDTLGASYSDYKNTIEPNLVAALATNHIPVPLLGPDTTQANDSWLASASTDLSASLQGYARQAFPGGANDIKGDTKEVALKTLVSAIYTNDPTNKPIMQTEMGDAALGPGSNVGIYSYGLEMGDFAVQIARAGVATAIAYLLDDDMHNTQWGMWKITDTTTAIRPWFFVWNVLCNTVLANSTLYAPTQPTTNDFRVLAAQSTQGAWTFVLVNRNANAQTVSVTIPSAPTATTTLQQYVYSNASPLLVDNNGFPLSSGTVQAVLNRGLVVSLAGSSIMILTQQTAIAATSYAVPRPPLEKRR